jgi:hypothetical protein
MFDKGQFWHLVESGLTKYAANLKRFWPAQLFDLEYSPKERNLTLYLGSEFLQAGYVVFHEVPMAAEQDTSKGRIDMVALSGDVLISCEAKRLYDSDEAVQICHDIKRMSTYVPHPEALASGVGITDRITFIIAQTNNPILPEYWMNLPRTGRWAHGVWAELSRSLAASERKFWHVYEETDKEWPYSLFAMVALFTQPGMQAVRS